MTIVNFQCCWCGRIYGAAQGNYPLNDSSSGGICNNCLHLLEADVCTAILSTEDENENENGNGNGIKSAINS